MRVGIITNRNLKSPWASTHFYIQNALNKLASVQTAHVAGKKIADHLARNNARRSGRRSSGIQATPFTPEMMNAVMSDLEHSHYDVLLALHASTIIPTLKIKCPLIYVTDATAALLNDYYPQRREQLTAQEIEWLQECEETTIAQSDAILVPTQWAADSVVEDYAGDPNRTHVIEWGGNFARHPQVADKPLPNSNQEVRFLFVGLDWERKGGDIAVDVVELLRGAGIKASLTVVGSAIPKKSRSQFVRSVGMLNRANSNQSQELDRLFREADFYIHPARAECYGHVLCEALGFGVPVIATQTGGISQCVIDGETGLLLPQNTSSAEYAERVKRLLADHDTLAAMRSNAVEDFRNRLNWDRWASRVQQILQGLLSPTVSTSSE